ncbi:MULTISPECIES: ABC transporter substrate-binding protein [Streptomyces]|uniref:Extracellular solute-binding protein n=1 Tax=Streptomyces lonegramiae TaxID=3075524 RepID=A0ABU2XA72_9ACTN|nr:extracellular solute-binding protein [Streptomyces sp. DSM 41529]MDT0542814.1 extracellular solute-binding protein [Streptomyces sp. DSM 41529]QOU09214.1 VtdT3 [Streptomyces sp.]
MNSKRVRVAACAAVVLSVVLTGCGGGDGDGTADKAEGPVTIEYWNWQEAKNIDPVVAKFNATHKDIKLKFVKQADNPGTQQNLRNAVAAQKHVPCLVQNFGEAPSLASEGLAQDVTEDLTPYLKKGLFAESALPSARAVDKYYAVPGGATPPFMMINRKVYDKYGVKAPKTWDDVIAAGKEFKKHGIFVMNLAGEDPSTLIELVQQAGGSWYKIDGDKWKIDFLSPESLKAAHVIQQLVDNDLVAHQTYTDRPALINYFDSGKMVSLPTSTWQLQNYEREYKKSLGDWEPVDRPQYADATEFVTPMHSPTSGLIVPKGCDHAKEAVEAAVWLNTSKESTDASYQKDTGQYTWPGAVTDPSPWVDSAVPEKLFGPRKSKARDVILKSVKAGRDNWVAGPNYTGMFAELQDQWAKVTAKKTTMKAALEHMQTWTVADLKRKNINVDG